MIAFAVAHNLHIHQMDVKTSFLNGTLIEKNYMFQLEVFVHLDHPNKVCRLFKTIYKLKQSSQMWYERFIFYLLQTKFTKCATNPNVYIKYVPIHFVLLGLYVDDSILVSDDEQFLHGIKFEFFSAFEMTNTSLIKNCLGI
jgi:hypothetical protein